MTEQTEVQELRAQLETARKALESAKDFIAEIAWNKSVGANASYHAREYLAQIGAGQKGGE